MLINEPPVDEKSEQATGRLSVALGVDSAKALADFLNTLSTKQVILSTLHKRSKKKAERSNSLLPRPLLSASPLCL